MIKKRINTDLFLSLKIVNPQLDPVDLSTVYDLMVHVWQKKHPSKTKTLEQCTFKDNVVSFQYSSAETVRSGVYGVTVSYKITDEGSETGYLAYAVDFCDLFELVESSVEDTSCEVPLGVVVALGKDGDSAYQAWLKQGNEGTIDDFIASLKGDPFTYDDFTPEQLEDLENKAAEDVVEMIQPILDKKENAGVAETKIQEHNVSLLSHQDLRDKLATAVGLPEYDPTTHVITFTDQAGATIRIDLPIEAIGLRYDADTKTMVFTDAEGETTSVPLADFIDVYLGSTGEHIQITIGSNNTIQATLLNGKIGLEKLTTALQAKINEIDGKQAKLSAEQLEAIEDVANKENVGVAETKIQEHNASLLSHQDIRDKLATAVGLPEYDPATHVITFTDQAGATIRIDLPIEAIGLRYDAATKTMVFTDAEGETTSVPLADFIDVYLGSTGEHIQISIGSNNTIQATLLNGKIGAEKLTEALQAKINEIDGKQAKLSAEQLANIDKGGTALQKTAESLTDEEKVQVRKNIGIESMTQAEYDALDSPDPNVIYIIPLEP